MLERYAEASLTPGWSVDRRRPASRLVEELPWIWPDLYPACLMTYTATRAGNATVDGSAGGIRRSLTLLRAFGGEELRKPPLDPYIRWPRPRARLRRTRGGS